MHECLSCYITVTMASEKPTTTTAPATTSTRCPKCGVIKKLGRFSCCGRDGTWFNQCGDDGDASFEHTWEEGFEACESEFVREFVCVLWHVLSC